jgi:hypothetical protein
MIINIFYVNIMQGIMENRVSVVGGCINDESWLDFRQRQKIFLFSATSRPYPRPFQSPIQRLSPVLFTGVKRPGREINHSPSNAEVNNECNCTSGRPMCFHGL